MAIIVLHLSDFSLTDGCIQSLLQIKDPLYQIILVDNGSSDGSGQLLQEKYPSLVVLRSEVNAGFTGGNNIGMQYAVEQSFEYVLLLNNDTFVAPDFLDPLVTYLDTNKACGVAQPLIYFNHDQELIWNAGSFYNKALGFPYTRGLNKRFKHQYAANCPVNWVTGCAMFIRTDALRKTGLFAANMFLYCEDVDLSFRIREAGYTAAYLPQSVVYHIAGASGKTKKRTKEGTILPQIHYYNLRNRLWLIKKYTAPVYWPTVVLANCLYVAGMLLYFLVRGRNEKFKAACKAVTDGIKGRITYESAKLSPRRKMEEISSV